MVSSNPPGATITIDGAPVGVAPVTVETLKVGEHEVEAALDGHQPGKRSVTLPKPGERVLVEVALLPVAPAAPEPPPPSDPRPKARPVAMGKLTLKTTPWTSVFLGSKKLGDTPLVDVPLPAGTHVLKLTNPDSNLESSIEVDVKPGQTTTKKLRL
ncbi:MAG: PEGA domain-containing protein [Myxococcaceae bacterium]|nr:PEGA domain-containing protein [Myxococcaceae bacterium]